MTLLAEIRRARGLTQYRLASRARVAPETVSNIERGIQPRQDTKRKLLRALGMEWSDRDSVFPKVEGK